MFSRKKNRRSARFFKTTLRAVLINSFISSSTRINSGPNILSGCFLHFSRTLRSDPRVEETSDLTKTQKIPKKIMEALVRLLRHVAGSRAKAPPLAARSVSALEAWSEPTSSRHTGHFCVPHHAASFCPKYPPTAARWSLKLQMCTVLAQRLQAKKRCALSF